MMRLDVDSAQLTLLAEAVAATESQIDAARARALRKMKTRMETRIKRDVAKVENIPQRGLSDRVFSSGVKAGDEELTIWIGTWNISPFSIGNPRQTGRGVRVSKKSYQGAFLGKVYTSDTKVWIRLYSRHYSPDLYPTDYRPGDRGGVGNKGRFPLVRAAIPIDDTVAAVLAANESYFSLEFEKLFAQELNYEINFRGIA